MAHQRARWGTRHFRRASIVTAVTAGFLSVTALAGMSSSTSAVPMVVTTPPATTTTAPPPATAATAGGWLALETGLTNRVTYDANRDLTPEAVQTLTGNSTTCLMSTDQSLLKISGYVGSGTTNLVSLKGGKIGVAASALGAACYQVNAPLERLDLELANPSLSISSALLDIEIKASARILATTSYKGTVTGYFQLQSGSAIGTATALPGGVTANATFTCVGKYDDDKDHGTDDDCRWPISTPSWSGDDGIYFDKISLQAVNGKFSLEGGADGDLPSAPPAGFPRRASLFELSASLISCGASTTTLPAELNAPQITVRRLANAGTTSCVPIPISVTHGPLSATILKPLAQETTAQFVLDLVWTLPITPGGTASTTATRMNFQTPGSIDIPLNWCPGPLYDGTTLVGIENPLAQQDLDGTLNGVQFACVGTSNTVVVNPPTGDDFLQITEQVYLEGDAIASRGGN